MGSMDSAIVSTGQQQGLESDGFMVLESWKENFLVPLEFDKNYSMQYLTTYVNEIPWNLFSKAAEGEVCGVCLLCHFFISSIWKGCDFWYCGNEQCDCKASLASVFEWCPLLILRDGGDVGLCWDRMVKGLIDNPALSRDIPESSATLTGCWWRGIFVPDESFIGFL